jgi:RAB protein geranylgeranyltransferase component A
MASALLLLLWGGGGVGLTIRSNVETRDSAQRILEYLESLKDVEADQEGTCSSFAASNL